MKNEKDNLDNIDELLADFGKQKAKHVDSFGAIEPPEKSQRQLAAEASADAEKNETGRKKKSIKKTEIKKIDISRLNKKKIIISVCAVVAAVAVVFGSIGIANYTKTAYLKPYKEKYPGITFPQGIEERFCDYYATHVNTVGYIELPDCDYKDYVVKSSDINPFIDKSNSTEELDFNTVIYINSELVDLEKAYSTRGAYLNAGQKIYYSTLFEDYEFNVIGAFYTNSNPADDSGYCFPYNVTKNMTGKSFNAYEDRLTHRFIYNTEYSITSEDKLITLAAKSDFMPDFRFVVVGVLNAEKQTAATENSRIHYPQVWYNNKGAENPYRFSSEWYPEIYDEKTDKTIQQSAKDFTQF